MFIYTLLGFILLLALHELFFFFYDFVFSSQNKVKKNINVVFKNPKLIENHKARVMALNFQMWNDLYDLVEKLMDENVKDHRADQKMIPSRIFREINRIKQLSLRHAYEIPTEVGKENLKLVYYIENTLSTHSSNTNFKNRNAILLRQIKLRINKLKVLMEKAV